MVGLRSLEKGFTSKSGRLTFGKKIVYIRFLFAKKGRCSKQNLKVTLLKIILFTAIVSTENDRDRYISVVSHKKWGRFTFSRKKVLLQKVASLRLVEK